MRGSDIEAVMLDGEPTEYEIVPSPRNSFIVVKTDKVGRFQLRVMHGNSPLPSISLTESVLAGGRLMVEVKNAAIAEVIDLSEALENISIVGNKIYATAKDAAGDHTLFVRAESGESNIWLAADYNILAEEKPGKKPEGIFETVDMSAVFNCNMTEVHEKDYVSPRPKGYSMGMSRNGRHTHTWHQYDRSEVYVDDSLFRSSGGVVTSPSGIPFATPAENENLACVSIYDVFPTELSVPLCGKGSENYGSSRSLQWRAHLYAYLSGAKFISEEWGGYNTFKDMETYELSEYGLVKKRFLDFVDKYPDVGEKVSPIAAVISNRLPCFTVEGYATGGDETMFGYPMDEELMAINKAAKDGARRIFQDRVDMLGTEPKVLINSHIPDAVDMLNEGDGHALKAYQYLVDITGEADFKDRYDNVITPDEVEEKLHELLPCRVDGGFHYLLNEAEDGYYLSVFNHSGIVRTVETGDSVLPEATKTATITLKDGKVLLPLEGNTELRFENGQYFVTLKGGEWLFAKMV
jgi:hypothetical protein